MKERDAVRALRNLGFTQDAASGTSHRQWRAHRNGKLYKVTLDAHNGEVKENDVRSMIKQAGVNKKQWYHAATGRESQTPAVAPETAPDTDD